MATKALYIGTANYGTQEKGKLVASGKWGTVGYWKGENKVMQAKKYVYLLIAGSHTTNSGLAFAQHIFRMDNTPENVALLSENVDNLCTTGEVIPEMSYTTLYKKSELDEYGYPK